MLGYLKHVKSGENWEIGDGYDVAIVNYLYDYTDDLGIEYETISNLRIVLKYTSSEVKVQFDFPKIQENFATMKVYFNYPDFLDNPRENIFTFVLKIRNADYQISGFLDVPEGGVGWRIIDYYLSYTEVPSWKDNVR